VFAARTCTFSLGNVVEVTFVEMCFRFGRCATKRRRPSFSGVLTITCSKAFGDTPDAQDKLLEKAAVRAIGANLEQADSASVDPVVT